MTSVYAELYKHRWAQEPYSEPVVVTSGFNFAQAFRSNPSTETEAMQQGFKGIVLSELLSGSPFTMGDKEHETVVAQSYQGWPLKCFVVEWRQVVRDNQYALDVEGGVVATDASQLTRGVPVTNRALVVPFRPIAHPLIFNSLLWAGAVLAVWEGSIRLRARRMRRQGRCLCGYTLSGLARCPECGRQRDTAGRRTQ